MHKFTNYYSVKSYQNFFRSVVCYRISETSVHLSFQLFFALSVNERPSLISDHVISYWKEWVLNALVWIAIF